MTETKKEKKKTFEELEAAFKERGFRFQELHESGRVGLFYKRLQTKRPCSSNEKDQLVVYLFDREALYQQWQRPPVLPRWSFEVDITGEFKLGWAKLQVYGLDETTIFERLADIEVALVRAWEALE